ncbi:WxL domain-containing protein [Enterococcus hulanensis]|uniref:WxL domain-containing protein n=1 Tax=Enterococcus hulanensis TaxID=2559929 RepID=A0ABU3EZI0_9ENTE|nr:WxL domain-containing protein [Enterococcus hulanensis]MDT2600289.1 WxL domain-containing protein [Enterococcus hulanensis]MDT2609102.1 WxL domain-containing protein [Enterococcus hulanensis]MDT2616856.1 WxL domain-containing protein [Enterococcus hulanensis]MDT2628624.1 WxL domain-containing protein [Enterococcus hulanensis]MDT2655964.1 WxL domain-containing protein [Enterococcus hulanensis]
MYMDDGTLIPVGKVPTANVDYALKRYDYLDGSTIVLDDHINPKSITIPYNGAGNYSHSETETIRFGIDEYTPLAPRHYAIDRYLTYYNLHFTNVPKYIRSISSISSVLGDYSNYTQRYHIFEPVGLGYNFAYKKTVNNVVGITNKNLTRTAPGSFKYNGGTQYSGAEHPDSVQFAVRGGAGQLMAPLADNEYHNHSLSTGGKRITFFMKAFQTTEQFMDPDGGWVPAPPGFTQNNTTDANDDHFTHTMDKLPTSYESGGNLYVLQGWHQKYAKPAILEQSNPPSITVDYTQPKTISQLDEEGYIRVIYAKSFAVKEKYVDSSNTSIDSGSWDTVNPVANNGNFTGTPAATKTDSSGVVWEYQGWKEGISGTVNATSVPVTINNITGNKEIYYIYKKKLHALTFKYVDHTDGTTLLQIPSNPRTAWYPDSSPLGFANPPSQTDTNSDVWDYVGWENVTDAPGIVNPTSTPISISSIKGPIELRYHYQARKTTATLDLKPTPQIVDSGDTVSWSSKLTNTGASDLKDLVLKSTSNWAAGLTDPVKVTVTPAGGAPQDFTVNSGDWATGVNLTGISIPKTGPNNYADITFTTTATGAVNQVLPAEIEVAGNIPTPITAENFVRIDDPDEPNLKPSGNGGLINIPDFRFGDVEVKPFAQTKKLDASLYQAGYHPYIRMMDNESNFGWELTVKLGQFTSGSKTLPTSTSIPLRNGRLMEVQNYNKPNESFTFVGLEGTKVLPSDGTTVSLTDHTAKGVYQLEYDLNNDVELNLMAHSGIAGLDYEADMDWTLTTSI